MWLSLVALPFVSLPVAAELSHARHVAQRIHGNKALQRNRVTQFSALPVLYNALAAHPNAARDIAAMAVRVAGIEGT